MGIESALFNAIVSKKSDLETVTMCLEGKYWDVWKLTGYPAVDINGLYTFEGTPTTMLCLAVKYGKEDVVTFLLKKGADPDIRIPSEQNMTALHIAILNNKKGCISHLIAKTKQNKLELIRHFSRRVEDNKEIDESIVHFAARQSNEDTVSAVINISVDVRKQEEKRENIYDATDEALLTRQLITELIMLRDTNQNGALHIAANGNLDAIRQLLRYKLDITFIDEPNIYGDTPLHVATKKLQPKAVELLMRNRADKGILNKANKTPKMIIDECKNANDLALVTEVNKFLSQTCFFGLPVVEDDSVNLRDVALREFNRQLSETKNLRSSLSGLYELFRREINQQCVKVAVIGQYGAGKSSIINAFAQRVIAEAGDDRDLTRYPREYMINGMLITDFPGFGTKDYKYSEFEKHFHWDAYDLILVVSSCNDKISEDFETCLAKLKTTIRNSKFIFIKTYLEILEKKSKNDISRLTTFKIKAIDNIKKILSQNQIQGQLELLENTNLFFVTAPTEDMDVHKGVDQLVACINTQYSYKNVKQCRINRCMEIREFIKSEYLNRFARCRSLAYQDWAMSGGTSIAKIAVPCVSLLVPVPGVGLAAGLGISALVDKGISKWTQYLEQERSKIPLYLQEETKNDSEGSNMAYNIACEGETVSKGLNLVKNSGVLKYASRAIEGVGLLVNAALNIYDNITKIYREHKQNSSYEEQSKAIFSMEEVFEKDIDAIQGATEDLHKHFCMSCYENENTLLMKLINENSKDNVFMGKLADAIQLLDAIDVSVQNNNKKTLLMTAVKSQKVLNALILKNIYLEGRYANNPAKYFDDIKLKDKEGRTIMIHAVLDENVSSLYILLRTCILLKEPAFVGESINNQEDNKAKILNIAISIEQMVNEIFQVKDKFGKNALMYGIEKGGNIALFMLGQYVDMLEEQALLDNADINMAQKELEELKNENHLDEKQNREKIEKTLTLIQNKKNEVHNFIIAIKERFFQDKNIKLYINEKDNQGKTALIYAIESGDINLVDILLQKGADINVIDINNKSALNYAIEKGNLNVVELLLRRGANANILNVNKKHILIDAIESGKIDLAMVILRNAVNIDVNIFDINGKTPLMHAIDKEDIPLIELLLQREANVNAKDKDNIVPLMYAIKRYDILRRNDQIVRLLLQRNANVNVRDKTDKSVLEYAAEKESHVLMNLIIESDNITPSGKKLEMIKRIEQKQAEQNRSNRPALNILG